MNRNATKEAILREIWLRINAHAELASEHALCEGYIDCKHFAINEMAEVLYDAEVIDEPELQEIRYVNDVIRAECVERLIEERNSRPNLEWAS